MRGEEMRIRMTRSAEARAPGGWESHAGAAGARERNPGQTTSKPSGPRRRYDRERANAGPAVAVLASLRRAPERSAWSPGVEGCVGEWGPGLPRSRASNTESACIVGGSRLRRLSSRGSLNDRRIYTYGLITADPKRRACASSPDGFGIIQATALTPEPRTSTAATPRNRLMGAKLLRRSRGLGSRRALRGQVPGRLRSARCRIPVPSGTPLVPTREAGEN